MQIKFVSFSFLYQLYDASLFTLLSVSILKTFSLLFPSLSLFITGSLTLTTYFFHFCLIYSTRKRNLLSLHTVSLLYSPTSSATSNSSPLTSNSITHLSIPSNSILGDKNLPSVSQTSKVY